MEDETARTARGPGRRWRRVAILLLGLLFLDVPPTACRAVLRYPGVGRKPLTALQREIPLNPFILTNLVYRKLLIEVDWVEGCEPAPKALAALERVARKYCPAGKEIGILRDDEIPRKRWEEAMKAEKELGEGRNELAQHYIGHVPDEATRTEVVYVLYSPRPAAGEAAFGQSESWSVERGGRIVNVTGLSVFKDPVRRSAHLWVTADRIDAMTLVHEFGHVLGLVGNPAHAQLRLPDHCRNPDCVMTHPELRSILYYAFVGFLGARLPYDYCNQCQQDIRDAQRSWEARAAADPAFPHRLSAWRETGRLNTEAWRLWWKGSREEAIESARKAAALFPDWERPHGTLGYFLEKEGRTDEAVASFREAMRYDRAAGLEPLVRLLIDQRRYAEVVELLRDGSWRGMTKDYENRRYNFALWLAYSYDRLGRIDEALSTMRGFVPDGSSDAYADMAGVFTASLLRRHGRLDEARRCLDQMSRRLRKGNWWKMERARLALAEGRREEARPLLEEVASSDRAALPKYKKRLASLTLLPNELGLSLALLGRREEARGVLAELEKAPEFPAERLALLRAEVLALLGDSETAIEALAPLSGKKNSSWAAGVCEDEDLASIRSDHRFTEMFPECRPPLPLPAPSPAR